MNQHSLRPTSPTCPPSRSATPATRRRFIATLVVWLIASATATIALGVVSCAGRQSGERDLVVTSFAGAGVGQPGTPIRLQFDRPVVGEGEIGRMLEVVPAVLVPAADMHAHWLDRQTLVLTPTAELKPSTRYTVRLFGDLAQRTGGYTKSFVNRPLAVEGLWGVDAARLPPLPSMPIHFNQEVAVADVLAKCDIRAESTGEHIKLVTTENAEDAAASINVTPATALAQGADFTFVCENLSGLGGDAVLKEAYTASLHTYPKLKITKTTPSGWDVPADEVDFEIHLSTPVTLEAARKHISLAPPATGFDNGWLDKTGTRYRVSVDLKPETAYKLRIDAGLTDAFGQRLGGDDPKAKARITSFRTGDARPRMVLETGIYAVEPASKGYPVWTRNVRDFDVQCATVPRGNVVSLLTGGMDYDPWYDANNVDVDWKKHGLNAAKHNERIANAKNKWRLSRLPLWSLCGGEKNTKTPKHNKHPRRGLYLAALSSTNISLDRDNPWRYRPSRRVLANVTDLGILTKAGTASGLVWVSSISTGKPVAGATVSIYAPTSGNKVFTGRTDKDGILRTPGTTKLLAQPGARDKDDFEAEPAYDYWSYRSQRLIVIAENGGDMGVVDGNWANGIQTWNFGVTEDRRSGDKRIRGFIQSDRGIYRPGENVHFKGLAREIRVGRTPAVPKRKRIAIEVEDSRGQVIYSAKKKLSRFGGFSFSLKLAAATDLGDYRVRASLDGQTFHETFIVQEFRKVTYEVALDGAERHTRLGGKLDFSVAANYLFGAPVTGAEVEWNLQRRSHRMSFPRYEQYSFSDWAAQGGDFWSYRYGRKESTSYIADGKGTTDKKGRVAIAVRDPQTNFDGPADYIMTASVTDATNQTTSKQTVVTAHKTDFYLGLHTQEWVQAVAMPFAVNVVALSPTGKRVPAKATLSMIRRDYQCTYTEGVRRYQRCKTVLKPEMSRQISISASGVAVERIMPKNPGEYILRVETKDGHGNAVSSSDMVWVLGRGEAFWSGDESARMSLIASKSSYKPGETAKLVPRTNLKNAHALVTLERNGVLDAFVLNMKSPNQGIEIPLKSLHAPNVYATVAMVAGRSGEGDQHRPRFKMGMVDLKVSPASSRLKVAVTTEKIQYQPGDRVSGHIVVTAGGKPVSAEVSLSVADEGVLQLIDYKTPDPMLTFYKSWGMGIDNSTNWNRIARLEDPSVLDPDEGGDSGGESAQRVRSRFVSSAYWKPSLVTDAKGRIEFTFRAPDNLTAFRLMAVAADAGSRFGAGERRITIKKPLLLKSALPRFATVGDELEAAVIVHNYTGSAGTAVVRAKAVGASFTKSRMQRIRLADGASARVRFPTRIEDAGKATFTFTSALARHRDAVAITIPVSRGLTEETRVAARGVFSGGQRGSSHELSWRKDSVADASFMVLTLDRTGLSDLEPSLRYLVQYPYGCLEQTLSRFVPLTKAKDLASSLGIESLHGSKMRTFIKAGVAKVQRHQHPDGHYSLWPSGQTYPHLTVYATYGLLEAQRAGVSVDAKAVKSGLKAIARWANSAQRTLEPGGDTATVAMAAYLLADSGKADHGLNARLYAARNALPRYGQAFLLRALYRAGESKSQISALEDELLAAAVARGDGLIVRETASDLHYYMNTDARSTAMVLSALLEVDPSNRTIDRLVTGLKGLRQSSGRWRNTQDNLYSLVALADYARKQSAGSTTVTIEIGGKSESHTLKGGQVVAVRRALDSIKPGPVRVHAAGKLRYALRLTEARRAPSVSAINRGFAIERAYTDAATGAPITTARAGQLIRVRVTVKTPVNRSWVAVVDQLPAGFEAVNTSLATSQQAPTGYGYRSRSYRRGWTHTELRDDRVMAFADRLRAGEAVLEYLVRATQPGTFTALPARAEEMYQPSIHGRSALQKITIAP